MNCTLTRECDVRYDFHIKAMIVSSLSPVVCRMTQCLIPVICVCLRIVMSNTHCVVFLLCFSSSCVPYAYPSGAPEFTPGFQWGSCYSIFSFICMFCRSLFVLLYFFFWPLCCLFFFDIWILIAPLVSSNTSCQFLWIVLFDCPFGIL